MSALLHKTPPSLRTYKQAHPRSLLQKMHNHLTVEHTRDVCNIFISYTLSMIPASFPSSNAARQPSTV